MAINKLALIRYKTLDDCLRNRRRKWTLEDLIERVSEVLYDREGIDTGVSRRTIQADLQLMRSDKLGYNAPVEVTERKYYRYSDADYSITKIPVNSVDVSKMREVLGMLKQFSGFSYFDDMSDMVARLENSLQVKVSDSSSCIQFEGNDLLKGKEHIAALYQAVFRKQSLLIEYRSFRATQAAQNIYFPYLLKEYRNRWFLICRRKKHDVLITLALDRILSFQELPNEPFVPYLGVNFDSYYSDTIGVTKSNRDRGVKVVIQVSPKHTPYVLTKPLHPSQQVLREDASGATIRIDVVLNFELERELLSFGDGLKVLAPRNLVKSISRRLQSAAAQYDI